MQRTATPILLVIVILSSSSWSAMGQSSTNEWRQVIDKNNVEVYTHTCHESNVRAFKATTKVNMPLDSVEVIFDNVAEYSSWQQSVKESKVVHRASDDQYHYYSRTQMGWPTKDRDLIWAVEKTWDDRSASLVYDQICSTNTLPEAKHEELTSQAFVSWRLEPIGDNQVKITYNLTVQQGGRIPNWLISMLSADGPYKTLANLKDMEIKGDGNSASLD